MPEKTTNKSSRRGRGAGIALLVFILVLAIGAFFMVRALPDLLEPASTPTLLPTPTPIPTPTPTPIPTPTIVQVVRVNLSNTASTVRVREQPSTDSDVLGDAAHNSTWTYQGTADGWWIIDYEGQTGYISEDFGVLESVTLTPSPTPTVTPTATPTQTQ